jgi:hypothetical protein
LEHCQVHQHHGGHEVSPSMGDDSGRGQLV